MRARSSPGTDPLLRSEPSAIRTRFLRSIVTALVAAILGFALHVAREPYGLWWLAVPALAIAISFATGLRRGWLFGTIFVLVDLLWVIVPASRHLGAVIPFLGLAIAAFEALPFAIAGWLFARTKDGSPFAFCYGVPATFALLETARASGPLGFPLATIGATQTNGPFAVAFAIGGVPLASFLTLVSSATIVFCFRNRERVSKMKPAFVTIGGSALSIACILVVSSIVWHHTLDTRDRTPLARIGIVEAGPIDVGKSFAATAADYAAETQRLPKDLDYVLWPEGVLFYTAADAAQQRTIASNAARTFGRPILAGATTMANGSLKNVLLEIDADGTQTSLYTKRRLVPFGEYQPFAFGVSNRPRYDAAASNANAPVRVGSNPFGVLICYEVAFGELGRSSVNAGATYLIAGLNDSWFAGPDGPPALAQLSEAVAIENGIAIARADAVPPSGVIDADGRAVGTTLRADGTIVTAIPRGLETPYRFFGETPILIALGAIALLSLLRAITSRSAGSGRSRRSDRLR